MRRWHQDRSLMLGRWEEEKRKHLWQDGGTGEGFEQYHCSAGPGLMRKARPWDSPSHHGRWIHRYHRQEVARSNKERRHQDRNEIALQTAATAPLHVVNSTAVSS